MQRSHLGALAASYRVRREAVMQKIDIARGGRARDRFAPIEKFRFDLEPGPLRKLKPLSCAINPGRR